MNSTSIVCFFAKNKDVLIDDSYVFVQSDFKNSSLIFFNQLLKIIMRNEK